MKTELGGVTDADSKQRNLKAKKYEGANSQDTGERLKAWKEVEG